MNNEQDALDRKGSYEKCINCKALCIQAGHDIKQHNCPDYTTIEGKPTTKICIGDDNQQPFIRNLEQNCNCTHTDSWRCAKESNLHKTLSCPCKCHKYIHQEESPIKAKFLAEKHNGMRIDHSGILGRIAGGCKVRQDQRWCLGELNKHLIEMAKRFYAGDIKAVDEFLQLWCLDDNRPKV